MLRFTCALARASSARARACFSSSPSSSSSSPSLASASSLVARIGPLPVVFLLAANTAVCGTYLVYGPSSSAVRRFYDANMVLSARRFRRRRWTIVTHFFTHLDALHLVVNVLSIYSFGGVACQMLGNARFAILYTLAEIGTQRPPCGRRSHTRPWWSRESAGTPRAAPLQPTSCLHFAQALRVRESQLTLKFDPS